MLILKLDVGEKMYINGNEIEVLVMGINGNQTRFGINAPRDMEVDREEIRLRKLEHDFRR